MLIWCHIFTLQKDFCLIRRILRMSLKDLLIATKVEDDDCSIPNVVKAKWNMGFLSRRIRVPYLSEKFCLQPFPIYTWRNLIPSTMVLEGDRQGLQIHP